MDDLRTKAKEAMKRMKSGFWEEHRDKIGSMKEKAKSEGIETSNIVKYYQTTVIHKSQPQNDANEIFYTKVKAILDDVGEVSDIIRRLIDTEEYNSLSYERKQKYIMELSAKYRTALERYKREKKYNI